MHCLYQLLKRLGYIIKLQALKYLPKYYEQCQKHGRLPSYFVFTLKDDIDFNYNVIINIIYIKNKPVLHLIEEITCF